MASNNTQLSSAALGAQRLLEQKAAAEKVIRIGAKRGIIKDTMILPNWTIRYYKMSVAEQTALARNSDDPTTTAYVAALKLAGASVISEMEISRAVLAEQEKRVYGHVQETTKGNGRPVLIDTPEARAEALSHFDFSI
jgi:hypothetical protein